MDTQELKEFERFEKIIFDNIDNKLNSLKSSYINNKSNLIFINADPVDHYMNMLMFISSAKKIMEIDNIINLENVILDLEKEMSKFH